MNLQQLTKEKQYVIYLSKKKIAIILGITLAVFTFGRHALDVTADKVTCSSFKTRAEAMVALKQGYVALDRDHDGIPCESLRP